MKSMTSTMPMPLAATAALLLMQMVLMPLTAAAATTLNPFTATEVATWSADRSLPSGGYESLATFAGRSDVLEMRVDKDLRSTAGSFYYTEGLKKVGDYGQEIALDMYVDGAWQNSDVRSGLWGVGADAAGVITAYPIIEFSTARADDSTGWRYWDGAGWVNVATPYTYNAWASLKINISSTTINFMINGAAVGSMPLDGTTEFDSVILNAYNYGATSTSYSTHWHAGITGPVLKADCQKNGYAAYGFKNQGQCVRYVETGKDSR